MKKWIFLVLTSITLLTSCKTPQDIAYLQDVSTQQSIQTPSDGYIRFQPGDKLSIFVHSRDEQLRDLFNISGRNGGSYNMQGGGQNYAPYTVDSNGEIDFPVLGSIKIEGLTRDQVAKKLEGNMICAACLYLP